MGPGHRLGSEASDFDRQVPRQPQWNSATQTKGELTTVADRPTRDTRQVMRKYPESSRTGRREVLGGTSSTVGIPSTIGWLTAFSVTEGLTKRQAVSVLKKTASAERERAKRQGR